MLPSLNNLPSLHLQKFTILVAGLIANCCKFFAALLIAQ
jgi:hypothetical protein